VSGPDGPVRRGAQEELHAVDEAPHEGGGAVGTDTAFLPEASTTRRRKRRSGTKQAIEWVLLIGAALAIALLIKTFLFQAFYIPSESMYPTLKTDDRVLVNKLSYKLHDIHRGDIVVFEKPKSEASDIKDLVKRVIALPGETVEGRDGKIYIDGRELREPYLPEGTVTTQFEQQVIPPNAVWVMGDNRSHSRDSRYFGAIPESTVIGRVFVRIWPLNRLGFL
jgi:signal peptidase I